MRFSNTYGVQRFENHHDIVCYCPLGKDYYSAEITVECVNPIFLPDYLETDKMVSSLSSKEYIIEELAHTIAGHFKAETEAEQVLVTAFVKNATHSPVEVTVAL